MTYSDRGSEPAADAAVQEDGARGLVIQMFNDSDKVGVDVKLAYGGP